MKRKFSTSWKSSKQPRKQRKYAANAPLHLKRKLLSVNLSKELRKKYGKRNIPLRKRDNVKIMRGKFKGKQGKVTEVKTKMEKIFIEKIQVKKRDGSSVNVPIRASNLQIIELNTEDRKRMKKFVEREVKSKKNAESQSDLGNKRLINKKISEPQGEANVSEVKNK